MSFIHLLFPPGELEEPGKTWPRPISTGKKIGFESARVRKRFFSTISKQLDGATGTEFQVSKPPEQALGWRRKQLIPERSVKASGRHSRRTRRQVSRRASIETSSLFPNQIEKGREQQEGSRPEKKSARNPGLARTSAPSPGSDSAYVSSRATLISRCDQFRSGPFGYVFDGLRLTDQERDFVEELVNFPSGLGVPEELSSYHTVPTDDEIVETLSQRTFVDAKYVCLGRTESPNFRKSVAPPPSLVRNPTIDKGIEEQRYGELQTAEVAKVEQLLTPIADDSVDSPDHFVKDSPGRESLKNQK
ncbi:hypothetical protein CLAIMM_02081 [Cladophialophora immunda]|nr:hypothetical protein CLAIMM_02081 [Cladophialophora immunda]